jgi:hypothetical protein
MFFGSLLFLDGQGGRTDVLKKQIGEKKKELSRQIPAE